MGRLAILYLVGCDTTAVRLFGVNVHWRRAARLAATVSSMRAAVNPQCAVPACLPAWCFLHLTRGFVIRVLVTMHMTWLVNSAVHVYGSRDYETGDNSRNNPLVALAVFGGAARLRQRQRVCMLQRA